VLFLAAVPTIFAKCWHSAEVNPLCQAIFKSLVHDFSSQVINHVHWQVLLASQIFAHDIHDQLELYCRDWGVGYCRDPYYLRGQPSCCRSTGRSPN